MLSINVKQIQRGLGRGEQGRGAETPQRSSERPGLSLVTTVPERPGLQADLRVGRCTERTHPTAQGRRGLVDSRGGTDAGRSLRAPPQDGPPTRQPGTLRRVYHHLTHGVRPSSLTTASQGAPSHRLHNWGQIQAKTMFSGTKLSICVEPACLPERMVEPWHIGWTRHPRSCPMCPPPPTSGRGGMLPVVPLSVNLAKW